MLGTFGGVHSSTAHAEGPWLHDRWVYGLCPVIFRGSNVGVSSGVMAFQLQFLASRATRREVVALFGPLETHHHGYSPLGSAYLDPALFAFCTSIPGLFVRPACFVLRLTPPGACCFFHSSG